jgi:hypothetical protein
MVVNITYNTFYKCTATYRTHCIYVIELILLESNTVYSIQIFSESTKKRNTIIIYMQSQDCPKILTVPSDQLTNHFIFTAIDKLLIELITIISSLPSYLCILLNLYIRSH